MTFPLKNAFSWLLDVLGDIHKDKTRISHPWMGTVQGVVNALTQLTLTTPGRASRWVPNHRLQREGKCLRVQCMCTAQHMCAYLTLFEPRPPSGSPQWAPVLGTAPRTVCPHRRTSKAQSRSIQHQGLSVKLQAFWDSNWMYFSSLDLSPEICPAICSNVGDPGVSKVLTGDEMVAAPTPTYWSPSASACSLCTSCSLACSSFFTSLSSKVAALKWRRLWPASALAAAT